MTKPRVGFAGVGWIGRHRMEAMLETACIEAVAIAEPCPDARRAASALAPRARLCASFDELLDLSLDGIVIATPSAAHAPQSIAALSRGAAVFCQKPLGRDLMEARAVIDAASRTNRAIAVDFSYRGVEALRRIKDLVARGGIGRLFAVELVFHNAYGPDKAWYYDRTASGGGCLMDLGVHLVDAAFWVMGRGAIAREISCAMYAKGHPLRRADGAVEDYVTGQFVLDGVVADLACSWNLSAGCDAVINMTFYGSEGGARLRNIDGSFYDFRAERFEGTRNTLIYDAPDAWGGRAAAAWARELSETGGTFDRGGADEILRVSRTLEALYAKASVPSDEAAVA